MAAVVAERAAADAASAKAANKRGGDRGSRRGSGRGSGRDSDRGSGEGGGDGGGDGASGGNDDDGDDGDGKGGDAHRSLFGATRKRLGGLWSTLGEAAKRPYLERAAADKARFDAAVAANPANAEAKRRAAAVRRGEEVASDHDDDDCGGGGGGGAKAGRSSRGKRRPPPKSEEDDGGGGDDGDGAGKRARPAKYVDGEGNEVKKNLTSFLLFAADARAQAQEELQAAADAAGSPAAEAKNGGKTMNLSAKVMVRVGELWKAAGEDVRKRYEEMAAADAERFKAAMATNPEYVAEEARKVAEKAAAKEAAAAASGAAAALKKAEQAAVRAAKAVPKYVDGNGNEVKKNLSSFLHFSLAVRPAVTEEVRAAADTVDGNGDGDDEDGGKGDTLPKKIMVRIGEMWAALDEAEKRRYEDLALADLERFKAAMATNPEYVAEEARKAEDKARPKYVDGEGNEVKRNLSAFLHFSAKARPRVLEDVRAAAAEAMADAGAAGGDEGDEGGGCSGGGSTTMSARIMGRLGELWKAMDDDAKKPYEEMAAADAERFKAAMATNPEYVAEEARKVAEKEAEKAARAAERAALRSEPKAAADPFRAPKMSWKVGPGGQ